MPEASKKRKRSREDEGDRPTSTVRVTKILQPRYPPVIVTTPGLQISESLRFRPFCRREARRTRDGGIENHDELLLHSNDHPRVDYTAKEVGSKHQKHYIGVYDPSTGSLRVIESTKMEFRGSVRSREASQDDMKAPAESTNGLQARNELLMEFGNKKARQAVEARTLNAIPNSAAASRSPKKLDAASKALLDASKEKFAAMATIEDLNKVAGGSRPVPPCNADATSVSDVYRPEDVIGLEVLNAIAIKDWTDALDAGKGLEFPFRYVAHRLNRVHAQGNTKMLRVLRYLYFLLKFYTCSKPAKRKGGRQLPPRQQLRTELAPATETVVESIRRKFSDGRAMLKQHIDLLATTCCVLSCALDGYKTDIFDLESDLRLDRKQMVDYFREIGARVKPLVDPKTKKSKTLAILALPLQFPQVVRRRRR